MTGKTQDSRKTPASAVKHTRRGDVAQARDTAALEQGEICGRTGDEMKKGPLIVNDQRASELIPAATYSPTHLRMQYHRRWQA